MKAYTYIVVRLNKEPGPKFYFGFKTVKRDNGSYYGSSKKLKDDIKKYGLENFKKTVVRFFNTAQEALASEEEYLSRIDAASNPNFYNKINGNRQWTTADLKYSELEFKSHHSKNFLVGGDRTDAQKRGAANKYKIRSKKRLEADKEHSHRMKGRKLPEIAYIRSAEAWKRDYERLSSLSRNHRLGKTKDNDVGRRVTSEKLMNNQNGLKGDIKLAKLSDFEFANYLEEKLRGKEELLASRLSVMFHTRRNRAIKYIETGILEPSKRQQRLDRSKEAQKS